MGYLVKLLSNFEKINNFDDLGLTLVAYKKINVKLYYFLCYTRIPVLGFLLKVESLTVFVRWYELQKCDMLTSSSPTFTSRNIIWLS